MEAQLTTEYRLLMADVYELAGLSRRISEREAAALGTTVARWHILSVVSEEPLTVPEISRRLGQVRQGVQRVVDELVADGQLAASANPRHKRSPRFSPTDEGCTLLEQLWVASEPRRLRVLKEGGLDAAALRQARETLRELLDAFSTAEPTTP
jgi:DNA-binding MarR family transcriptional regulator